MNSPSDPFLLFSPFLKQRPSPILSPFPHLRKISDDFSDLISFRLEPEPQEQNEEPTPVLSVQCPQLLNTDYALQLEGQQQKIEELDNDGQSGVQSPQHSQRCEMPSTKFHEPNEQIQPPELVLSRDDSQPTIQGMIEFLVQHSQLKEDILLCQSRRFHQLGAGVEETFKILANKFRRLKKTKEELTKYCMRKAFKFVSEQGKKETTGRGLEGSMRRYFAEEDDADSFSVPFKKNSAQKTMNGNFLKRVFGCPRFAADYRQFLEQFDQVVREDNSRKVAYLAKLIEDALGEKNIPKIQSMRRLPWTAQILHQTRQLASSLPQQANGRRSRRQE